MLNKTLAFIFAGCSMLAFASVDGNVASNVQSDVRGIVPVKACDIPAASRTRHEKPSAIRKAEGSNIQWIRPRGQFFTTGWDLDANEGFYPYGTIIMRPWTEYTYLNVSNNTFGSPEWTGLHYNPQIREWQEYSESSQDLTMSYLWGEMQFAPLLTYKNQGSFGYIYNGENILTNQGANFCITYGAGYNSFEVEEIHMPYSSLWYNGYSIHKGDRGLVRYTGLDSYDEGDDNLGWWFGTNTETNACALRFEKPQEPYLLKSVQFYYSYSTIKNPLTLKAYVFKTEDSNVEKVVEYENEKGETESVTYHQLALGELLASSEAVIPAAVGENNGMGDNMLSFYFTKVNPVNGSISSYELEIEDDITVVVVGYNAPVGDDSDYWLVSPITGNTLESGYGNLAFLGNFEISEDGEVNYSLTSMIDYFGWDAGPGIMIDVDYPWIRNLSTDDVIRLANSGDTEIDDETGEITKMGLQFPLYVYSTSTTEDMEDTYDGEDECEWLKLIDVKDFTDVNEDGDVVYAGQSLLLFEADPNPNDESRVCTVKVSIPAASYEITFLQGSNAEYNDVTAIVTSSDTVYYDLMGRRVTNPEKGIYIQKTGKDSKKVIF